VTGVLSVRSVGRVFKAGNTSRVALQNVSFELDLGATVAVVGESGAGKSTLARMIAGLDTPTCGDILLNGVAPRPRAGVPSPVQMVFQDPREALNPFRSIGQSVGEPLRRLSATERKHRVAAALTRVGLDPARAGERPAAFSGGQLQRVVIARALAPSPQLLVCDEPTSSLDVSVQAQIVNLLLQLQQEHGFACVLVTHDLAVARVLADDVLVLRRGVVVEHTPASTFFIEPCEDYSRSLLRAVARQSLRRRDLQASDA
jgi:ABC-type dipeptide/oligopeptide/nickel transport system ATPase subunit